MVMLSEKVETDIPPVVLDNVLKITKPISA